MFCVLLLLNLKQTFHFLVLDHNCAVIKMPAAVLGRLVPLSSGGKALQVMHLPGLVRLPEGKTAKKQP